MSLIFQHKDISVIRNGEQLILQNRKIQRIFDLSCGAPKTISLQDDMKKEFGNTFVENKQIIERSKDEFSGVFEKICSSIENIYSKVSNACKRADNDK